MKSKPKETKVTQEQGPAKWREPGVQNAVNTAGNALETVRANVPTTFKGPLVAQANPFEVEGANQIADAARVMNPGTLFTDNAMSVARGDWLNPSANRSHPLWGVIDAARGEGMRTLERSINPSIKDDAIQNGYYGGTAQRINEGVAAGDLASRISELTGNVFGQNYVTERGNMMNAPQQFLQGAAAQTIPGELLMGAGAQLRSFDQLGIDNEMAKIDYASKAPFAGLSDYMNLSNMSGATTGTSTQVAPGASLLGQLFQGALGGASLGREWGTKGGGLVGGVLGGLGGLFG